MNGVSMSGTSYDDCRKDYNFLVKSSSVTVLELFFKPQGYFATKLLSLWKMRRSTSSTLLQLTGQFSTSRSPFNDLHFLYTEIG